MNKLALALVLGASIVGCSTTSTLNATERNPGSAGKISAKTTDNGNTKLDVQLNYLPPPGALGATTYVVWIRPDNGTYLNVGQVAIDDKRHGHLETTTPHSSFTVLVTGEAVGTASTPSETIVLTGVVDTKRER